MIDIKERFVVDENGKRTAVLLDIADYERLLEELEELESVRAYDAAMATAEDSLPLEEAIAEIEKKRKERGI